MKRITVWDRHDQGSARSEDPVAESNYRTAIEDMLEKIAAKDGLSLNGNQLLLHCRVHEISDDVNAGRCLQIRMGYPDPLRSQRGVNKAIDMGLTYSPEVSSRRREF